jgi:hypothetical protein
MQNHSGRVSNWTAAALVAAVAATTGYLAHAIPATSSAGTGTGTSTHTKSPGVAPAYPAVQAPVVTSGGSGAGGSGTRGGDN